MAKTKSVNHRLPGHQLSIEMRSKILGLREADFSYTKIATVLNLNKNTVATVCRKAAKGFTNVQQRSGRPLALTQHDRFLIKVQIRREPTTPLIEHWMKFRDRQKKVCYNTYRQAVRRIGFFSAVMAIKPLLTRVHIINRRIWTQKRRSWTMDQWSKVVWSDESRFCLHGNDGRTRVIRMKNERYWAKHIQHRMKFESVSVMVWGCFTAEKVGPLVVVDGILESNGYVNILSNNLIPWLKDNMPEDYIFQEDGASCHRSVYSKWWKATHGLRVMEHWPANSPDLNPIENIWDVLKRRVAKRKHVVKTRDELIKIIQEEWVKIPKEVLSKLVASMPRRCDAIYKARGRSTKY